MFSIFNSMVFSRFVKGNIINFKVSEFKVSHSTDIKDVNYQLVPGVSNTIDKGLHLFNLKYIIDADLLIGNTGNVNV